MVSYPNNIQYDPDSSPLAAQTSSSHYLKISKSRLDLLLRILQRPFAPRFLTPHFIHLRLREPLGLNRGVVPNPRLAFDISILHDLIRLPVRPLVNRHYRGASKTEIVLQRDLGVLD